MRIRYLIVFLIVLTLCFCGCKKDEPSPDDEVIPTPEQITVVSISDSGASDSIAESESDKEEVPKEDVPEEDIIHTENTSMDQYINTYWTASEFTMVEAETWTVDMPWEMWSVDIFLYEGGKCRFLSVMYDAYLDGSQDYADCVWYIDESTDRLCIGPEYSEEHVEGYIKDGRLYIDCYGGTMTFDQKEMPAPGGQWCMADLVGTWNLVSSEVEGCVYTPEADGVHGAITFHKYETELEAYYAYEDFSGRTEVSIGVVAREDKVLYDGFDNKVWRARLVGDKENTVFYASLIDRNTMEIMIYTYFDGYEYPAVCSQIFEWEGTGAVG